jgi:hypothetical protein
VTPEGRSRSAKAGWKHGRRSEGAVQARKSRMAVRREIARLIATVTALIDGADR